MADIVRWNPFSELLSFRDQMDRMFDEVMPFRPRGLNRELDLTIPINVYETGDEIVVKAYLPGIKPSDLDITVTGNVLSIRGQMREEREEQGENFFRREIQAGNFLRQVTLPTEVISDKTQATYEDGVLRLRMPKAETSKARSIKINTGSLMEGKQQGMEGRQLTGSEGRQSSGMEGKQSSQSGKK